MKAVIELDVPEWQIGQQVEVFFPDTMMKKGVCELLKDRAEEIERLKTPTAGDNHIPLRW